MKAMKIMHIPEDLATDILLYLPVKSLLRFRCVRKSWCDLMENPNFVTEHHHKQITLNSNVRYFIRRDNAYKCEPVIRIIKDDGEEDPTITEAICPPTVNACFGDQVFGPCNGLYCVSGGVSITRSPYSAISITSVKVLSSMKCTFCTCLSFPHS
ncbi:putative F-box protein At3g47150 [Tripterygium wilfordii]|uniref:putative F-box protein At3g47150 n=1 Tax=Tripterygium wilfordii TaxID=458696 RepID=UPI0018F85590|nr:putative F-box protein At3g47150 [Tripterygium wilfordii]